MKKHFFSHLIELDTLHLELEDLEMEETEKNELRELIESNVYHSILDSVLSQLSDEDKRIFLLHLSDEENEKIWELIDKKVDNIEEKIKKAAEDIKKELINDILDTKRVSGN